MQLRGRGSFQTHNGRHGGGVSLGATRFGMAIVRPFVRSLAAAAAFTLPAMLPIRAALAMSVVAATLALTLLPTLATSFFSATGRPLGLTLCHQLAGRHRLRSGQGRLGHTWHGAMMPVHIGA